MGYHDELKRRHILLQREKLKELPVFISDYFRAIEDRTTSQTRLAYLYDLKLFFDFLVTEISLFMDNSVRDFSIGDLKKIDYQHIEEFMDYLTYYVKNTVVEGENGEEITERRFQNDSQGKSRKLYSVRAMFDYYFKKRRIDSNPAGLVESPKVREKSKVYLDFDEVAKLLDEAESGEKLTEKQKEYHNKTRNRDLAILTLLLGTGIRVTECVGIDINHINFEDSSFMVTRKGGNQEILYFSDEVAIALGNYFEERLEIETLEGHENAFFLSIQNRRITDRAIQKLVKKYSLLVTRLKKITPHKLRTTFGTNLYRETGDIYLVADVLGHKDVNTTKKHYADTHREAGRRAVRNIMLRDDE